MLKRILVGLAVLLACGAAWYMLEKRTDSPSISKSEIVQAARLDMAENDDSNLPAQAQPLRMGASSPYRPPSLRQKFEQSRDLFALVQEFSNAANSGDAAAKALIADSLYECIGIALPIDGRHVGAKEIVKVHPELKGYVDWQLGVDNARCGRFTKHDIGSIQAVISQYENAAKAGNAKALAMMLTYSDLNAIADSELATDVEQIINSGDPYAIGALSNLMGLRAENRQSAFGPNSGAEIHQYAWQLAACRMGMDCGPDSSLLRGYCLAGGICGARSVNEVISSSFLSPADYRAVVAESQQIVKSLPVHH